MRVFVTLYLHKSTAMFQIVVTIILLLMLLYVLLGVVFSFFFLTRGLQKIDEDVPGSSWGFRLIIIPGCILLWPLLLNKWRKAAKAV